MDKELEKIINKYLYSGISVIHTNKNEVDYHEVFGYQDLENQIKTSNKTIYRIASISKVVVALGLMKLYEMGKILFTTDISDYLGFKLRNPLYPDKVITLEMVMTQTSSLSDKEQDGKGYDAVNGGKDFVALGDLLANKDSAYYAPSAFSSHEPGTYWEYSNLGCGVCACVIEKVSGMEYNAFLKKYIFDPLNLDASYRPELIKDYNNIASLYEYDDKNQSLVLERTKKMFVDNTYPIHPLGNNFRGPAGGLFISPFDLSKIMLMMMNDGTYNNIKLFEKSTLDEMKRIHWQGESTDPEYKKKGLQLLLLDGYSKDTLMGHFGCAYGLRSFMLFNHHDGYIFMCNGADYGKFSEHMVIMEEEIIKYLVNKFERSSL